MTTPTTCTKCGAPLSPGMQTCRECGWSTSKVYDHGQAPAQPAARISFGNKAPHSIERPLKISFDMPEAATPNPKPAPRTQPPKRVKPPKLPKPPRERKVRQRRARPQPEGTDGAAVTGLLVIVMFVFFAFVVTAVASHP